MRSLSSNCCILQVKKQVHVSFTNLSDVIQFSTYRDSILTQAGASWSEYALGLQGRIFQRQPVHRGRLSDCSQEKAAVLYFGDMFTHPLWTSY